jgi:hypothetical protein
VVAVVVVFGEVVSMKQWLFTRNAQKHGLVFVFLLVGAPFLGCDGEPLPYQSCYPEGEEPPPIGPLYDCFIEWCVSDCDNDNEKGAQRERREEKLLAPNGDSAETCWTEKTGNSDQYIHLERGCTYARTFSKEEE